MNRITIPINIIGDRDEVEDWALRFSGIAAASPITRRVAEQVQAWLAAHPVPKAATLTLTDAEWQMVLQALRNNDASPAISSAIEKMVDARAEAEQA